MKNVLSMTLITLVGLTACQKNIMIEQDASTKSMETLTVAPPLEFSSDVELRNTLDEIKVAQENKINVKSCLPLGNFLSFAETVMQEDDYDARPNALCSEIFGSILNPDGEVIFGKYMLKIGKSGILYSFKENKNILDILASTDINLSNVKKANTFFVNLDNTEMSKMYEVCDFGGVYIYDLFGLIGNESENPKTKWATPADVTFRNDEYRDGVFLKTTFTIPSGSDQKAIFSSNSKIANDTKIYNENILGYKECGVKTKTMRKKVVWKKFSCDLTAAITDLAIQEPGWATIPAEYGWLDINTTHYNGRSFIIATRLTPVPMDIDMSVATLNKICEDAVAWGKEHGLNYDSIDGIRYIPKGAPQLTVVRIKDIIENNVTEKITKQLCQAEGTFNTDKSSVGAIIVKSLGYEVIRVSMYGYSEYSGERLGSRMRFQK